MPVYHINDKGRMEICHAHGNCPYGIGDENHYFTEHDAKGAEYKAHQGKGLEGKEMSDAVQRGMVLFQSGGGGLGVG